VDHQVFGYAVGVLISLNAGLIAAQTERVARNLGSPSPRVFQTLDWCFCILFTLELAIRMLAYKQVFFGTQDKWWNLLDCALVGLQVFETVVEVTTDRGGVSSVHNRGFSGMRVLRILRVIRIIRLVRVLRLIGELRTIVVCILGSLRSLAWTVVLLLMMIFMTAVYLTHIVSEYRLGHEDLSHDIRALQYYYGSLFRSILTLYQATAGGLSWDVAVAPLIDHIHPLLGVVFALYIAFVLLAIMNVVTGVFVESAMQSAKQDKDIFMVHNVRELFSNTDTDEDGLICWDEFQSQLNSREMEETLKLIDVDICQARELFQLLDVDDKGMVNFDDFLDGCMRLRGPARSIDLMTVMYEHRRFAKLFASQMRHISVNLRTNLRGLAETLSDNVENSMATSSTHVFAPGAAVKGESFWSHWNVGKGPTGSHGRISSRMSTPSRRQR